jgi:hypothetical protein
MDRTEQKIHTEFEAIQADFPTGRSDTWKNPASPGASQSPHRPGMVPDRSTVPGHFGERVPRAVTKRRPLSQYGTAEELLLVYKQSPEDEIQPDDFNGASEASFDELRKAYPWDLPPVRPAQPALAAGTPADVLPEQAGS